MAKKMKIDFEGVEKEIRRGGGAAHIPEADYLFKIVSGELRTSEKTGGRYFNWRMQVHSGEFKGKTLYYITSLKREALWNLRNFIHAATSKNVAGKAVNFDPDILIGKVVAGTVEDEEYENKMRSRIVDVRPKDELETEDEEEDEEEDSETTEDESSEEEEELEDVDLDEL